MYNEGDITRMVDLGDPSSGRLSQLVRRVSNLITRPAAPDIMAEQRVVVTAMLKVISYHAPFYFKIFHSFFFICVVSLVLGRVERLLVWFTKSGKKR